MFVLFAVSPFVFPLTLLSRTLVKHYVSISHVDVKVLPAAERFDHLHQCKFSGRPRPPIICIR